MKEITLLLFLSDYKKVVQPQKTVFQRLFVKNSKEVGTKEKVYTLEGTDRTYSGIQTNDAPVKFLIDQAENNGSIIKRVICITSYKVMSEPDGYPQYERFQQMVKENATSKNIEFKSIPYDYLIDSDNNMILADYKMNLANHIYKELSQCFKNIGENEEIYIDYTGGMRDISFLMTSIIRFLEIEGLTCGEIVYSNNSNRKLYRLNYIYDLYQLINGVNEYVNTGNARELNKVNALDESNESVTKLINAMLEYADALSICDIEKIGDKAQKVIESLEEIESITVGGDANKPEDMYISMIKTLIPLIRDKMHFGSNYSYPDMIRWCAENNMIQQAVTLYVEKMPKYYFAKGNIVPAYVDLNNLETRPGYDLYTTGFYTELFDRAAEGLEVKEFYRSLNDNITFNKNSSLQDLINGIQNKINSEQGLIRDAYIRLRGFINNCYMNAGTNIVLKQGINPQIYGVWEYAPNNNSCNIDGDIFVTRQFDSQINDFWNNVKSTNYMWQHYFLYNNEDDFKRLSISKNSTKDAGNDKTLRKKLFAVERVRDGKVDITGSNLTNDEMSKIMAYYLAAKIIRNRMNHAGEANRSKDEEETIKGLNSLGIGIDFSDNIESYKKILLDGIKFI